MPVDPQVQAFLEAQAQAAIENQVPPITEQTVEMARAGYLAVAEMLGRGPDVDTENAVVPARPVTFRFASTAPPAPAPACRSSSTTTAAAG